MKKPVIIDCDPGHDDALALMLACGNDSLDLKAVTTVAGNQTLDKTSLNALKILSFISKDIEIAAGAAKPLLRKLVTAPQVHGESGLDGPILPDPGLAISSRRAVDLLADTIKKSDTKITLIPMGPLTNIALLFLTYPDSKAGIEEISLMGGAHLGGNTTPAAEFNILVDPEAAKLVFESKLPITMCGLDVTHKAQIFSAENERMRNLGRCGKLAAELIDYYSRFHTKFGFKGSPLHDPVAVARVIDPDLLDTKLCHVSIETKGELTTGATVVDYYDVLGKEKNAAVAFDLDRERFLHLLLEALRKLG